MKFTDVDGRRVAFEERGEGPPVVLLHGWAGSKAQWRSAIEAWSDRYRILAPDLLGYGDTDPWFRSRALTLGDEVEVVAAIAGRTERPIHLVGHGYGGSVALVAALTMGPRLASLSLIEPTLVHLLPQAPGGEPGARDDLAEIVEVARDIADLVDVGFPMAAAQRFVDYWCGAGAWARMPTGRRFATAIQMGKVEQDFGALLNEDTPIESVRSIRVPTLIACGTVSPRPTRRLSRLLAEAIPQARHRTVSGAGHMLPLSHAGAVNALVAEHMESVDLAMASAMPDVVCEPTRTAVDPDDRRVAAPHAGGLRPAIA